MLRKTTTHRFLSFSILFVTLMMSVAALSVQAEMCPITTDPVYGPDDYGGVSLNKTLTLLNEMDEVRGAAYDPKKGEVVFVTEGIVPLELQIDMDDLVVAARSVFGVDESGIQRDPAVSFDDPTGLGLQTGLHEVRFEGATRNTQFGQIMYEADYILKKLGQGVDENGNLLRDNPALQALGYKSSAERVFEYNLTIPEGGVAYWFTPKNIVLSACDPVAPDATCTHQSFVFTEMTMQVETRYEDANGNNIDPATLNSVFVRETQAFAQNITDNYDAYAEITGFEALKKLKRLGKIVSVVRWLRDNYIPVDLSFMDGYEPVNVETPATVNLLQLCSDGGNGVDGSSSGLYAPPSGSCPNALSIVGGVSYRIENLEQASFSQAAMINDAIFSTNRVLNAQVPDDMGWQTTSAGTDYNVFAQTVAPSGKEGATKFNNVDFSVPNSMGQQLAFTRHYDSFSGLKSGFGAGWSELPFELIMPESTGVACPVAKTPCQLDDIDTFISYRILKMVDRVAGKTIEFEVVGTVDWMLNGVTYTRNKYASPDTNDLIVGHPGDFTGLSASDEFLTYYQFNKDNINTKQVWFQTSNNSASIQKYSAKPRWIIVPEGGAEGTSLEYIYDTQDRLSKIFDNNNIHSINVSYADGTSKLIDNISYSSPDGVRTVDYSYQNGRLDMVDQSGVQHKFTYKNKIDSYSAEIEKVEFVNASKELLSINSDLEGRETNVTPNTNTTVSTTTYYDRNQGIEVTTDSLGREQVIQRDDKGRFTSVVYTATVDNVPEVIEKAVLYESNNPLAGPTTVTDERGNSTTYTYDMHGNIATITDSLNRINKVFRGVDNTDGFPLVVTQDPKGRYSAKKYDTKGRLLEVYQRISNVTKTEILDTENQSTDRYNFTFTYLAGYKNTYAYDDFASGTGALTSVTDDANALQAEYPWISQSSESVTARNEFGQVAAVTSAAGYETTYNYNGFAKLTSQTGPTDLLPVSMAYKQDGLTQDSLASVSTALGTQRQSIDIIEKRRTVIDEKGVATTYFYNDLNKLDRVVELVGDGDTRTTQYFYDGRGLLETKILPNGHRVSYGYDNFNRLRSMQEKEGTDAESSNNAPVLNSNIPSNVNITQGNTLALSTGATDSDVDDVLRYYLVGDIPEGMVIDSVTGDVFWTPSVEQQGSYDIAVQVVEGSGGVTTQTITLNADDSIAQNIDNCIGVPNQDQRDTDGDGYGNACDPDLNNDNLVNFADLALFKTLFGSVDVNADFNGDGIVDYEDLELIRGMFGQAPGSVVTAL